MVLIDTAKTVLVPAEIFQQTAGEDYLRFGGMALEAEERFVVSESRGGIVAVMGVRGEVAEKEGLITDNGEAIGGISSPLLEIAKGKKRNVNIFLTTKNVYIAVWEKWLRMAEVLPDNSVDSLLFYMQVLGRRFNLKKFDINVGGEAAGIVSDSLRQYFRGVVEMPFLTGAEYRLVQGLSADAGSARNTESYEDSQRTL